MALAWVLGVRTRGAAGSERAQPVVVALVTAPAWLERRLSYHGPEGQAGAKRGESTSFIHPVLHPSNCFFSERAESAMVTVEHVSFLPLEQAGCSHRQQRSGGGLRGSCTNRCHFCSWVQLISVPLLLACSDGCVSAEVQSVAGFDVFCWWFLVRSRGPGALTLAVTWHSVMEPCPGCVLGALLCIYTNPELPGWMV